MILGDIREYLKQRDTASVSDVAAHFDVSQEAAELALNYWVKKGKVRAVSAACGSSCDGCGSSSGVYQWTDKPIPLTWYQK